MQVICAWCAHEGKAALLAQKPPLEDTSLTHGICNEHLSAMRSEIRARFLRSPVPEAA